MCENFAHKSYKKLFWLGLNVINVSLCYEFNFIFCVFRSFYGSKSSILSNIVPVSTAQTNICKDDLQASREYDDNFDVSSNDSIDYESTEKEIIESGNEFEQHSSEEPLSSNSNVEIFLFNLDSNVIVNGQLLKILCLKSKIASEDTARQTSKHM